MPIEVDSKPAAESVGVQPARATVAAAAAALAKRRGFEFAGLTAAAVLVFILPLIEMARYASKEELYSHVPLIPCITAYLIWINRSRIVLPFERSVVMAGVIAGAGLVLVGGYFAARGLGWAPGVNDRLAVLMGAFVCFVWGAMLFSFGWQTVRALLFPVAFLAFLAPVPSGIMHGISVFFQYTSAEASYAMIKLPGTPVLRDGLVFQMPGIVIEVAEECSGIRSSFVLFITSLIAGYMFFHSNLNRFWLAAAIVPLAILRNGLRIFTIAMLCVHVDPGMINSYIHKQGGPIFFALSLVPFFLFMMWLRRREVGSKK